MNITKVPVLGIWSNLEFSIESVVHNTAAYRVEDPLICVSDSPDIWPDNTNTFLQYSSGTSLSGKYLYIKESSS
jgi:hypothetical protein